MNRGDIYHVDLDPSKGREQKGARYVMDVSPTGFNRSGTQLICPITIGGDYSRHRRFAVSLSGAGTIGTGVVFCDQPRTIDIASWNGRFSETPPNSSSTR